MAAADTAIAADAADTATADVEAMLVAAMQVVARRADTLAGHADTPVAA
jgi:hypothetical protein